MNPRLIPRTAVRGYLRLARLPLDTAIRLLPGNGSGPGSAAELALDRADASIRAIVATILADPVLRDDAQRRRVAAEERQRALRLRAEAERKSEEADARLSERQQRATRRRHQADERAQERRQRADKGRKERARSAAKTENRRRQSSRKATARAQEALDERARKTRLDTLDSQAEALREKDEALAARDEARRLGDAAARNKAARKSD